MGLTSHSQMGFEACSLGPDWLSDIVSLGKKNHGNDAFDPKGKTTIVV